ncbi:preprotein translocase subunit SecE [Mycolicibacterium celeriflavum]|uniref:Protein translocase subunit SecE n=1 Tax=Mycolicibacterium celeriflavum TaxID=1249101 RepID=A0A1X0BYN1_MYCCF|nr:preprotein translocase subunit SecE [Mycolicibacterium celeriflavum]MCV7236668.1 preprotein translocase subunit SecE [Mycolicibacterium celeriflavum]ORA49663.1 preprotein translocase subunit SecE [Mycolicibacterium celeriflavum]BBY44085.1 protein translocase subunit SecE [Mycolicibacterium celeriflavum]
MSDERDGAGSAGDTGPDSETGRGAVVTRPTRPTGKRSRRAAVGEDAGEAVDLSTGTKASPTKNGSGTAKKTARKRADRPGKGGRNPFVFVWTYLQQVVAELRKVIWPNRKQMVSYTIVVLVFLVFMVALIGFVDLGLAKLVTLVFG